MLWTKRKLLLIGSGIILTLNPSRKNLILCEEVKTVKLLKLQKPAYSERRSGIFEIIGILRKHLLLTLTATGTAVLAAIMSILSPIYVSKLIDEMTKAIKSPNGSARLTGSAGMLLGISLANALLTAIYIKLIGDLGERIAGDM